MVVFSNMNVAVDSHAGDFIGRNNNMEKRLCTVSNDPIDTASCEASSDDEDCLDADAELIAMVFWNPNLMERIISYVPLIKDRINIEKCCRRMRDMSSRSPYLKNDCDAGLLDMHFQRLMPEITVAVSGNEIQIPVAVSSSRVRNGENGALHPAESIEKFRLFLKRFVKQITSLRIGSIHDIQRRMNFITDHELVLSPDLCDVLGILRNLRTLCIRNCVMTSSILDKWTDDDSELMKRIETFCLHGIWFDRAEDCDRLMNIIKCNVRRIHLSNCGTSVQRQLAHRIIRMGCKLDYIYLLLNVHSIDKEPYARDALERLSQGCRELRVCICLSTLEDNKERNMLNRSLRYITEYPKITVLELDIGVPDSKVGGHYEKFFRGLRNLPNLRVLRISSIALRHYNPAIWRHMVCGITHLDALTELAVRGIGDKMSAYDLKNLCEFLPKNLEVLNLYLARRLQAEHVRIIADRCNKLEVLLALGAAAIDCDAVVYAVENLHNLQSFAMSNVSRMSEFSSGLVQLVCNKDRTPRLDAISIGRTGDVPFTSDMLSDLRQRFHFTKEARAFFCEEKVNEQIKTWHLYRSQQGFQRIFDGMSFGECPGCDKDLTMFDEES